MLEAESEDKILASRPVCPRGLNITDIPRSRTTGDVAIWSEPSTYITAAVLAGFSCKWTCPCRDTVNIRRDTPLVGPEMPTVVRNRKSAILRIVSIKFVSRANTSIGQRSFSIAAPVVWNALPPDLRSPHISRQQFRSKLKTSVPTSLQHCMIPLRTICWRVKLCNCNCNCNCKSCGWRPWPSVTDSRSSVHSMRTGPRTGPCRTPHTTKGRVEGR